MTIIRSFFFLLLTIFRVRVLRMNYSLSNFIEFRELFWTFKTIWKCFTMFFTTYAASCIGPQALSCYRFKVKSGDTFSFSVHSILACIKCIANSFIKMSEKTIFTRAVFICATWRFYTNFKYYILNFFL